MMQSLRRAFHIASVPQDERDTIVEEVQNTLAALADVETYFEAERERLAVWDGPSDAKSQFLDKLAAWHRLERGRIVERLEELQRRMGSVSPASLRHLH